MSWKEGDFKRWPGDAVFVGGKGVKRLHSIFASIPTLLYKKVLLIFSGKGGPDTALKKILQNRQIQNILMTWTAQCVRLYGLQEYDFRTPSCVHFGVLSCSPLRDVKSLGFFWKETILEPRFGVLIWRTKGFIWSWGYENGENWWFPWGIMGFSVISGWFMLFPCWEIAKKRSYQLGMIYTTHFWRFLVYSWI